MTFLSHFNQIWIFSKDLNEILQYQISWKSVPRGLSWHMRRVDISKLTGQGLRTYDDTRLSLLSQFYYFFWPTSVSILRRTCVYIYTYMTAKRLYKNYCCYQIILRNIFYTNQEQCDVLGPDLAVTGRIRDIGQNVLETSFETESSSSSSYDHISLSYSSKRSLLEI